MTDAPSNAQAIVDIAVAAAEPQPLDADSRFYAVTAPAGSEVCIVDLEDQLENHRDRPRRKTGTFNVHDAKSFTDYLDKHETDDTEVWADTEQARIVGVINAHGGTAAGHSDHRVVFTVRKSDAWKAWKEHDGQLLSQAAFAEHIEDRAIDIVRPDAADMLELAQSFQATIGVTFESSKALSSGERQLTYKEQVDARAGRTGQLEIPKDFDIAVKPFEGADPYRIRVRFRYRISDGNLRIGYRLERPADIMREAFLDVVAQVEAAGHDHVFRGIPA